MPRPRTRPFSDVYETTAWTLTASELREVERRRNRYPEPGPWLIGHVFVCLESFVPHGDGRPRLDPGAYEVVSFWNHGPILKLDRVGDRSLGLEWWEIERYGQLYSPEEWARRATHAPKPKKVPKKKAAVKKRPKKTSKPRRTVWDRLGEDL